MAGNKVKLTPKGLLVIVRQRRISLRKCSGVGWVKAVKIPRPPAFETAEASSAVPTYYYSIEHGKKVLIRLLFLLKCACMFVFLCVCVRLGIELGWMLER